VDVVVARRADHEGFAPPFCHEPGPGWLAVSGACEVGEPGDVVHLHLAAVLAQLAPVPQEPGNDFLAGVNAPAGSAVGDDRGLLPFEGDAAEPCDQGFLVSLADADGLEAGARPGRGLDDSLVAGRRLAASVLSSEVSLTHRSRSIQWTSPASTLCALIMASGLAVQGTPEWQFCVGRLA
jgi:hypothetical protein